MNSWNLGSGSKYTVVTHRTGTQGTTEQREGKFRSLCEGKKKQNREMEEVNQKIRKKKTTQKHTNRSIWWGGTKMNTSWEVF